ncbi:MAG: hypothetical protein DMF89_06285 [Acidobacteria bacterium]|nr:MAG: hypothetical protein DMF90_18140 [Acidobacteriota bacterium]PYR51313.1 MAG: hypothetical protein DMF89_06285 [Acidobacteriota bacterium]
MTRVLAATAALAAAVAASVLATLPPPRLVLTPPWNDGTIPGLLHVHTNRSDGRFPPDVVAQRAASAGLRFLVFTDHGTGTRPPDPPMYRSGVLCLDAVEISTTGGHYLALDAEVAPYPLGGEARDVVDDVRRLGGFGVAAHPDSPKGDLRWREWAAPIDAVEIINPDTSWRLRLAETGWRPKASLLYALFTYPVRPSETIAGLLTNASESLAAWDALIERRPVVALAGVDAHEKLEIRNSDPDSARYALPIPGYESSFRSLSLRVRPDEPWRRDAAADAKILMRAIRAGHVYAAIDGWATSPSFEFTATHAGGAAQAGDEIRERGPVTLNVRTNLPPGYSVTVWQGGRPLLKEQREASVSVPIGEASGVYRADVRSDDRPDGPPWILSNPIYVRRVLPPAPPAGPSHVVSSRPLFDGRTTAGWSVEHDRTSVAGLDAAPRVVGTELRVRFGLSGGSLVGQFAAAAVEVPTGLANYDRVQFRARGDRPMRVSIQARAEVGGVSQRWQRSVYLETTDRERTVTFEDMTRVGETGPPHPPLADVRSLLFVVDTTNTAPGASGRLWVSDAKLERLAR